MNVPDAAADGVMLTQGGRFNGVGLYLLKGKPVFHYNYLGLERTSVAAKDTLAPGDHKIEVKFDYSGGGAGKPANVTLLVDSKEVAEGRIEKTIPINVSLDETLDVGEDTGTPMSEGLPGPVQVGVDVLGLGRLPNVRHARPWRSCGGNLFHQCLAC